MPNPNCYECKHRANIPGNAHSSCRHPALGEMAGDQFDMMFSMLNRPEKISHIARELHVTANPHGIHNNWFFWPVNFDPVWLFTCDGFESAKPISVAAEAEAGAQS